MERNGEMQFCDSMTYAFAYKHWNTFATYIMEDANLAIASNSKH